MAFKDTPFHKMIQQEEAKRLEMLRSCPPTSTFGLLAELPIIHRGYPRGYVLRSPLSGLVFVPYEQPSRHSWNAVVVQDTGKSAYPVGCLICVSDDEVIRSARVDLS